MYQNFIERSSRSFDWCKNCLPANQI